MSSWRRERGNSAGRGVFPDESECVVPGVSVRPSDSVSPVPLGTGTTVAGIDARCRQKESENSGADPGVDANKDVLLGMGGNGRGKKVRFASDSLLESEGDVPEDDLAEFVDRMDALGHERGSEALEMLWREHSTLRLKELRPDLYPEYERRFRAESGDHEFAPATPRAAPEAPRHAEQHFGGVGVPPEEATADEPNPDQEPESVEVDDEEGAFCDLEDGEEEARRMRVCRPCNPPSKDMVEQHNLSHPNYRSWCPVCVAAAGNDRRHVARPMAEGDALEIHSDYAFCRNRRGDGNYVPVLVSKTR